MEIKRQELTDESAVRVFNEYGGTVIYVSDAAKRNIPKGSYRDIPLKELKDLVIRDGRRKLFDKGYLMIKDERVRELLSLEPLGEYNLTRDGMKELLNSGDLRRLETFLQYTSDANLIKLINVAVELPVKDLDSANLIQAYSGRNIIKMIREKEEDQVAETGVRQRVDGRAPENAITPVRGRIVPKN